MNLKPALLEILVCPKCKQSLALNESQTSIDCRHCRLRYPVRDEIPVMLVDEAQVY